MKVGKKEGLIKRARKKERGEMSQNEVEKEKKR